MQEFVLQWFEELWLHYPLHPTTHGEVHLGEWDQWPPERIPCFGERLGTIKGNVVRTNVYHKYIKDLKLNITIDLDGFIY